MKYLRKHDATCSFHNMAALREDGILLRSTNRDLLSAIFKDTIPGMPKNVFISLIHFLGIIKCHRLSKIPRILLIRKCASAHNLTCRYDFCDRLIVDTLN
jgi:hypothetical protein